MSAIEIKRAPVTNATVLGSALAPAETFRNVAIFYGCLLGATKGLVSIAIEFLAKQASSLLSAIMLWSSGMRMVDPAPSTSKTLAARMPLLNFVSAMGTET